MPESRDRLSRAKDVHAAYARRNRRISESGVYYDEPANSFDRAPFRWGSTPMTGFHDEVGGAATGSRSGGSLGRGSLVIPRRATGRERGGSILPSWYPRTPLRDITSVVRAIERRQERMRETEEGLQLETPTPQDQIAHADPTLNAQLEHIYIHETPTIAAAKKHSTCPPSVAKILLNITKEEREDRENSELLTPQRKLLNSIDAVGKALMEELEKMKNTPSAKKALRDKKVRTLLSMR